MQNPSSGAAKMLDIRAKHPPQKNATCTVYRVGLGQCTPSLVHACHAVQVLPTLVFTVSNTAHSTYFERFAGAYVLMLCGF